MAGAVLLCSVGGAPLVRLWSPRRKTVGVQGRTGPCRMARGWKTKQESTKKKFPDRSVRSPFLDSTGLPSWEGDFEDRAGLFRASDQ